MFKRQNFLVCKRSYKKYLPDIHFADVTVDYKTSVIVVHFTSLSNHCIVENLINRIFYLRLKYEVCWIIVHDNVTIKDVDKECLNKIKENYFRFYYTTSSLKTLQSFKLKFLYAYEDTDVVKWITAILSKSLKYNHIKSEYCPISNFPASASAEEMFLVSFPSLNPYVVHSVLSTKMSVAHLINSKLEDLCSRFQYVPKRFFADFQSLVNEKVNFFSSPSEEIYENVFSNAMKSNRISRNSVSSSCPQKLSSNSEGLVEFINCLENVRSSEQKDEFDCFFENSDNLSESSKNTVPDIYSDMSLEEIDRNYRALQAQDMEYAAFDVDFENNLDSGSTQSCTSNSISSMEGFSCKSIFPSPKKRIKMDSSQVSKNGASYRYVKESQTLTVKEQTHSRQTYRGPNYPLEYDLTFKSSSPKENAYSNSLHYEDKALNSQVSQTQQLNFSQYKYKKKRQASDGIFTKNKHMKYSPKKSSILLSSPKKSSILLSSPKKSSILMSSPRIRKGQSSRTVCKQVRFENVSPCNSIENILTSSDEALQDSAGNGEAFQAVEDYSRELDSTCFDYKDLSWTSQDKLTLTPRTSQKLSFEKIPGEKGQTRLVFY